MTKFLATCDNTVISVCHTAYYESAYSIKTDANIEALVAWVSTADGLTPIQATGGRCHR
ncbi:MAG: hypothetical protein GJ680_20305 [Alteromonadaceae bacterium]|nr:hypothetical protein [Alteromonadaceae bacterium]